MRFAARDENSHNFTQAIRLGPVKLVNFAKEPYASNREWKVNLDQFRVKENVYQPIFGGYTEGAKAIAEELIAAYTGQKAPKDALADARAPGHAAPQAVETRQETRRWPPSRASPTAPSTSARATRPARTGRATTPRPRRTG